LFLDEGIVGLLLFMFWVWAILDVISTDSAMARNLPKMTWLIIVIVLPDIGAIAWLLLGRPERASWRPGSTDYAAPRRPVGLEDSPRYSASPEVSDRRSEELNQELERWELDQKAKSAASAPKAEPAATPDLDTWQQKLDEREAELRRRELELRQRELDQRELDQREREIDQ
jgi:hypothetical protein